MEKRIQTISMGKTWTTYMGSAYGVMKDAGLWTGDISLLMGKTGMAFHFIVHEAACVSSVTVYDWYMTHFNMMDIIGVYTDSICLFNRNGMNTFARAQKDAILKIKASIDNGKGVVIWAPTDILEFGIITGYSDEDQVFFVTDCISENPDPLLYDNIGRSRVPYLYVQCFHNKVQVDDEKIFRDSLQSGIYYFNQIPGTPNYSSGPGAYDNLISTLKQKNYDAFGLSYIVNVYADSKSHLSAYLDHITLHSISLKNMDEPAELFHGVSDCFQKMAELIPFTGPGKASIDEKVIPEVIELAEKAKTFEIKGMSLIEKILE